MKIADLDLPEALRDFYQKTGLLELHPPQAAAVERGLLNGKSILAAIPTASGKTLLAEMAMLKSISNGGKAIYIVPLKSLASEKYDRFMQFEKLPIKEGGVRIGIATGDYESKGEYLGEKDIIVVTSEKTDSLLRNGASWMNHLSVVVADEVHLIDSANRGPTLEVTLTKLMKINPVIQVLALSATIGNARDLAKWLKAELVHSDWRPTKLREGVFFGKAITFSDSDDKLILDMIESDGVLSIVADTLKNSCQCLVFANSRKSSESIAKDLSKLVSKELSNEEKVQTNIISQDVMRYAESDTCRKLAVCVSQGVAFHHAGLKGEHRRIVEDAFRKNIIKVIACTPTLAAGLNLPARRVIIRDFKRFENNSGNKPIPVLEYKQMAGRAGRPRLDPYGESILIAKTHSEFEELFNRYIYGKPEIIYSRLGTRPAIRAHILSIIATDFCRSRDDIQQFMNGTFFAHTRDNADEELKIIINDILDFLLKEEMIEQNSVGSFRATKLGILTSKLYIDPLSTSQIVHGLKRYQKMKKDNVFGLLHLICSTNDVRKRDLRKDDWSLTMDYVNEHISDFLVDVPDVNEDTEIKFFLKEIKAAALVDKWINESSEDEITSSFNVGPGDIRDVMDSCTWLMHGTAEISRLFGMNKSAKMARELEVRIEYGINHELLDLVELTGVGRARARKLYDAGFTSREKLKDAKLEAVASIPGISGKLAVNILNQLGRKIEDNISSEHETRQVGQSTLFSFNE
jgi:Superfamily II helicase